MLVKDINPIYSRDACPPCRYSFPRKDRSKIFEAAFPAEEDIYLEALKSRR